jgi:hypothetical protein
VHIDPIRARALQGEERLWYDQAQQAAIAEREQQRGGTRDADMGASIERAFAAGREQSRRELLDELDRQASTSIY